MSIPLISIPKKANYVPLGYDLDFYQLFKKICARFPTCFLFESLGESSSTSRYAIIGFAPEIKIHANGKTLVIGAEHYEVDNPYLELQKIVPMDCIARRYAGGLAGYVGYDAVNYFEPTVNVKTHPLFNQFSFGVYTDGLVLDTETRQILYFYYTTDRSDLIRELISVSLPKVARPHVVFRGDAVDESEHEALVEKTKAEIIAGNTFQCEVGIKSEFDITGDKIAIYERLRTVNPSPYMYYYQDDDVTILGASPELLLQVSDRAIETIPLAGTTKRGKSEAEDKELSRELLNDPKEIAEHVMLVDMHRSDIGRVSIFGSVKVSSLMDIKRLSRVQHIGSTIRGILRPGEDMFSALASLLPGGVLSGAPKVESIKIIDQNETLPRGPYGGAIGTFGFNGDATFAVPIRTLFCKGSYAYMQTSSGIVYDSDPKKEYQEIQNKLAAMKTVLQTFV